jgi:hypothetical protein
LQATQASPRAKACKRVCLSNRTDTVIQRTDKPRKTEGQLVTGVWQKWRFSAPQTHLWLIKVWFSASTFVVKIATFAKRQNVTSNTKKNPANKNIFLRNQISNKFYDIYRNLDLYKNVQYYSRPIKKISN